MRRTRQPHRLLVAVLLIATPLSVAAQVTTDRAASILLFPKVVADGTADTVIQIANQTRNLRHARCFYIDGVLTSPDAPPGPDNPPAWMQMDFDVFLTPQQPTHWVASRGRVVDPTDGRCGSGTLECDGAGFDPGDVPPAPRGFRGEMVCIEEDAGGFPVPGNALIGKATLQDLASGDVASYHAIGLTGFDTNDENPTLCLGGGTSAACPHGAEYAGCPQTWILDHLADAIEDPIAGQGSSVTTTIAVIPCAQNFAAQTAPAPVTLNFVITTDFEERFSASTTVLCWADVPLSAINPVFSGAFLGADYVQTRISPQDTSGGFVVVAQTFRTSAVAEPMISSAALNLHTEGVRSDADLMVIPVLP